MEDGSVKSEGSVGPSFALGAPCLCMGQGNLQAVLKPGIWLPGVRALHQHIERWEVSANPAVVKNDLLDAVRKVRTSNQHGAVYQLKLEKDDLLEVIVFTKCRYVYVVRLEVTPGQQSGSTVTGLVFSTGIFPAWFPLGFLFSCLFFFVPICSDASASYLRAIRNEVTVPLAVVESRRKC